jgi:hypothetical protein
MSDLTRKVFLAEVAAVDEYLAEQAQPAADRAALRDRIAKAVQPLLMDTLPKPIAAARATEVADAVLAVLPAPTDRAAVLTAAERTMLTYALNQAQEHIWSRDGFTDEDQAAIDSLRRMADEAQPDTGQPADPEHCVHDRAVHTRHHHQPVDGCPWCAAREQP